MAEKTLRILYLDDYELDRALIRDSLKDSPLKFELIEAENEGEFNQLISSEFDLVLSDFNILGYTGLQVLKQVQETAPGVPVIIVTGTGSEEIAAEAIKRGAADYVIKTPQHIRRLPITIQAVLEKIELEKERQQTLTELAEREAHYSLLMNTLQEGLWTIDQAGKTTFVNPAMAAMLGYTVEEMLGRNLFDFIPDDQVEIAQENLARRKQGVADQHDFIFQRKDGSRIPANLVTAPIMDKEGNFQGAVATVRDVSSLIKAQAEIQQKQRQLRELVENTPGSTWTLDRDYRFIDGNQAFRQDMEKAFGEKIESGYQLLSKIPKKEAREWKSLYDRALAGERFHVERERKHGADGTWYEYHFSPIHQDPETIVGVMVQALDITQRKNAESGLAENLDKYQILVDQIDAALFLHDLDGTLVEVNRSAASRYGYTREELLGLHVSQIDPDYQEREDQGKFWKELNKNPFQKFEARHRTQDGAFFPVEVTLSPVSIQGRDLILALAADISDRKQALRQVHQTVQKYHTLTEYASAVVYETDARGRCIYVNPAWQKISGLNFQEAMGEGWIKGVHPDDRHWIQESWKRFVDSGESWDLEYRFQDKEGQVTWVKGTATPLRNEDGAISGYLGTNTIITDLKEAEKLLQERNQTLNNLLTNLPGMVFRCRNNPEWEMLFTSQGALALTGYLPQELTADTFSFTNLIHSADRQRIWDSIQASLEEKKGYSIEYRIIHRDGTERWVQEQGVGTKIDPAGNVIELEGFIQDITDRVKAARDLEQSFQTLTAVLESIDAHIYVADIESYQILYMNDKMRQDFDGDHTGALCHQVFRGEKKPCEHCKVGEILADDGAPTDPVRWESRNPITGRWYQNIDRAIYWLENKLAHIQIAVDIHDRKLSEEALRESNYQLQLAQEIAGIGNWFLDPEVGTPVWSEEIYRIYEKDPEQGPHALVDYRDIYKGEYWELFNKSIQDAIQEGKSYDIELKLELPSGRIKWIHSMCQPDPNPGPAGHTLHGTIQDITIEKQIMQEIQSQQEFYNQILNNAHDGIWVSNQHDRFIYLNPAMEKIAGVGADDLIGLSVVEDLRAETAGEFLPYYQEAKDSHRAVDFLVNTVTPAGRDSIQAGWLVPRIEDGKYRGMICTIHDVTEQTRISNELAASEERFRALFENMLDGFALHEIELDDKGKPIDYRFLEINPAFEDQTGLVRNKVLGNRVTDIIPGIKEDPVNWIEVYGDVALTGKEARLENYSAPLGKWFSVLAFSPQPNQFATIFRDITQEKEAQQALIASETRYRTLFEGALEALIIHQQGTILEVNQTFLDMFGARREDTIGESVTKFAAMESQQEAHDRIDHPFDSMNEYTGLRKDGSTFPILLSAKDIPYQGETARLISIQNISPLKEIETALRESETRYRSLVESSPIGIITAEPSGKVTSVNQSFLDLSGYREEEFIGRSYTRIPTLLPQDLKFYGELVAKILKGEGLEEIEFRWKHASGEIRDAEAKLSLVKLEEKSLLQVMVQDITERKISHQALKDSEARYRELFVGLPNISLIYDGKGRIRMGNQAAADYLDTTLDEMRGRELGTYIPELQDDIVEIVQRIQTTSEPQVYDHEVRLPSGKNIWLTTVWKPIQLPGESEKLALAISTDITERKQFEQKLHENEQLYRQLYQYSGVGVGYYSPEGKVISYNEIALNLMGKELDQVVGKSLPDLFPREAAETYHARIEQTLKEDNILSFEDEVELPSGSGWYLSHYSPVRDQEGEVSGVQILSMDITERKIFEERLQRSDFIINSTSDAVVTTRIDGTITYWNTGAEQVYGYSAREALGQPISMIYREEDLPLLAGFIEALLDGEKLTNQEVTVINKNGNEVNILLTLSTIQDDYDRVIELVGVTKDITPIKAAQLELWEAQQRTQQYLDVAEILLLSLNPAGEVETINPKGCQILGLPQEEIVGKNWFDHFLDQKEIDEVKRVFEQTISGEVASVEYYENFILRPDGSRRLIAWHNSILKDEENRIIGVFSSGEDITDRKAAEIELIKSKETAESYLAIAAEIMLSLDRNGKITMLNPSGHRLLGYQPGELIGRDWIMTCLPKADRKQTRQILSSLISGFPDDFGIVEANVITKSGEIRNILWHNSVIRNEDGRIIGTLSSGEDITEKNRIVNELRRSRELLLQLSQAARTIQDQLRQEQIYAVIVKEIKSLGYNSTLFVLSEDGETLRQKDTTFSGSLLGKAARVIGIPADKFEVSLKTSPIATRILQDQKTIMADVSRELMEEALQVKKSSLINRVIDLLDLKQAIFAPLVYENQPLGLLTVLGDDLNDEDLPLIALFASQASAALNTARITEALQERTADLERLTALISEAEESERKRLAEELHDQVGQSLALLGFNLNQLRDQLESYPEELQAKIHEAENILYEVTGGIRAVMDDLSPAILEDYGLNSALHWYGEKIGSQTGLEIIIESKDLDPRLERTSEIALFRITQEALTNITRHADAKQVEISLVDSGELVQLTISDDGIGFDPALSASRDSERGWGLINMRERVKRLGGTFGIESGPGEGTKITLTVPR